jgi:AAA+ ATPase superfamily predicted ATPase
MMMTKPLKSNPGGQLAPDEVIGRDRLVARLWDTLEGRSVVLTAERRMGKTSVLKKLEAQPLKGFVTIRRDLENISSPLEFVERLFDDIKSQLNWKEQGTNYFKSFVQYLEGIDIKIMGSGFKLPERAKSHWKILLEKILEDLTIAINKDQQKIVFLWDELPLMIDKIRENEGEKVAMDFLDSLRYLRQTYNNVRMVYTGSIGLHHVLTKLKKAGYSNAPTNDMETIEVPPLSPVDANDLCRRLLLGEKIVPENSEDTVNMLTEGVDYVPFYIHSLVKELKYEQSVNPDIVKALIQKAIVNNNWELSHFNERIDTYYDANLCPLIRAILDILAVQEKSLRFVDLINLLKIEITDLNSEQVREVLKLLRQDHYLQRNEQGEEGFYFSLIKRWWCLDRGLV